MKELPIIAQIIFGLLLGTLLSLVVLIGVTYGAEAHTSSGHETYQLQFSFLGQRHDDVSFVGTPKKSVWNTSR